MRHPLEKFRFCPVCGSKRFVERTAKSKRCEECSFELFINPSAAAAAFILNERGQLLVVRRGCEPAKGTLDLPGGFSDIGETSEQTICREIEEETGLTATSATLLFSLPNDYLYSGFHIPTLDFFYECRVDNTDRLQANDDAGECFWMDRNDIQPDLFGLDSIRKAVTRWLEQQQE